MTTPTPLTLPLPILAPQYNEGVRDLATRTARGYLDVLESMQTFVAITPAAQLARMARRVGLAPAQFAEGEAFGSVCATVHARALVAATASGLVDRATLAAETGRLMAELFAGADVAAELAKYTPAQLGALWREELNMAEVIVQTNKDMGLV